MRADQIVSCLLEDQSVEQKLLAAAKGIKHCGDYGCLFYHPGKHEVHWTAGDADGPPDYTHPDEIKKLLQLPGIKHVEIGDEWSPKREEGWKRLNEGEEASVLDAPDMEHWSKRLSIEERLSELYETRDENHGAPGNSTKWEGWFSFGANNIFSVYSTFIMWYKVQNAPVGMLYYQIRQGDWEHHNQEQVNGQGNILRMIDLLERAIANLRAKPPTKVTDVTREWETPLSYAYGVERYGIQNNHDPSSIVRETLEDEDVTRLLGKIQPPHKVRNMFCPYCGQSCSKAEQEKYKVKPDQCPSCLFRPLRVNENLEPEDTRAEVDRLLPTKTVRLRGNSMLNASGVIQLAQHRWRERSKKAKQNAMDIVKAWQGLPEDMYLAILNGKCEIEADGDDAVIVIKQY